MLAGENGILKRAGEASETTKDVTEGEQVQFAVADALTDGTGTLSTENVRKALENEFGKEKVTEETFTGEEEGPWTFTGEIKKYTIESSGSVSAKTNFDISKYVKTGDYVNYNPTIEDKDGTKKVAKEKLTYISYKGSVEEHGNGAREQTFEASEEVKWRVFNINKDGTLDIIPDAESLKKVGLLRINNATGYYYAEQELNSICAIYGYGYGAVKNSVWEYEVGGQPCESVAKQMSGTGARCFSGRELANLTGVSFSELMHLQGGEEYSYDPGLYVEKFGGGTVRVRDFTSTVRDGSLERFRR